MCQLINQIFKKIVYDDGITLNNKKAFFYFGNNQFKLN